jgi:hypothetical protein
MQCVILNIERRNKEIFLICILIISIEALDRNMMQEKAQCNIEDKDKRLETKQNKFQKRLPSTVRYMN